MAMDSIVRCVSCEGYGWVDDDEGEAAYCDWCGGVGYVYRDVSEVDRRIPESDFEAVAETLEGLKEDGRQVVPGIFAAVPYCVDLIGGPYLETNDEVCKGFRPKSAIRAPK